MARFTRVLSFFAVLLLVSACGGGGGDGGSTETPLPPVIVDSNADYAVTYTSSGSRPTAIANGHIDVDPSTSKYGGHDTFNVKAIKKNVTISTLVFRCVGDCSLIQDIYFMYLSSTQTGFLPAKANMETDGSVVVNFVPPLIAETGMEDWKAWLGVGYNIKSFDENHTSATFYLEYDGTDSRNLAIETATGLPVNGNKQVITTPGHIICPQTTLSDSWAC